jgi:hypothetical protein
MPRRRSCSKFTVGPGRTIYRDGRPFVGISREGDTYPTMADDVAHVVARLLNRACVTRGSSGAEASWERLARRPAGYYGRRGKV